MDISRLLLQSGLNIPLYEDKGIKCELKSPTIRDIIHLEQESPKKYFGYVYTLASTRLDMADVLFMENSVWYEDIASDWEFFIYNSLGAKNEINLLFKKQQDKTISEIYTKAILVSQQYTEALNYFLNTSGNYILWSDSAESQSSSDLYLANVHKIEDGLYELPINFLKITEATYNQIVKYLRMMHWINNEHEFLQGGNRKAKEYILKHDYQKRMKSAKKEPQIDLSSIISSIIVKGQSYNDVLTYSVYLVYELYYRLGKVDEWNNTMRGLYSGAIDTKKNPIRWDELNWNTIIRPEKIK